MATNTNTARQRQSWQRGQQADFRFAFLKSDQTAMQSLDPAKYPAFAIYSPAGIQVQTGIASAYGAPGNYRVLWTVPVDAQLTSDVGTWVVVCSFISAKKKTYEISYDFDVRDKQITSQENRDVILLGVENAPFRVTWRGDAVPNMISLSAFNSLAPDQAEYAPIQGTVTPTGPVYDGDSVAYYYDVPANTLRAGMYTFLWNVQENSLAPTELEFQQLRVLPRKLLQMIPQVKFLVGRFQAAFDLPNYISDADFAEGLMQGVSKVNQWHPLSSYSYEEMIDSMNTPSPLSTYWLWASAWWVLHSQHMVETNLAFNFCLEENSLVATNRGLVKLKHLDEDTLRRDIRSDIASYAFDETARESFEEMCTSRKLKGFGYTADDIIEAYDLPHTNHALSHMLTRIGMEFYRTNTNPRTWAVCRSFYDELQHKLGIQVDSDSVSRKFKTKHVLDTRIGHQRPTCVFDVGEKRTILVVTNLGYSIEGTKDHTVPVLTKNLEVVDRKLKDVDVDDILLVKRDGFDELDDWDVDFSYALEQVENIPMDPRTPEHVKVTHKLPTKMTKSLARVLGYMTSEGWLTSKNYMFGFCNSDDRLIKDFQKHWKRVFGFYLPERESTNYETITGKTVRYFGMANAKIFKFLVAIGYGACTTHKKEVPWVILRAPKKYVVQFLQTFFEGDGCYSVSERHDSITRTALFSSSSNTLRNQLQQLLLRFGIVSSNKHTEGATVASIVVRGAELDKYADQIGFWIKGKEHTSTGLYYTQMDGLPPCVLDYIKGCCGGMGGTWVRNKKTGERMRLNLGARCYDPKHPDWSQWYYRNTISRERFKAYFEFNAKTLKKYFPERYEKLHAFYKICDNYVYTKVVRWESGREGHVYDVALPGNEDSWSHYFYANGVMTHNSGASASLDYDRTSGIESSLARLQDQFSQNLTQVKIAYHRLKQGVGVLSVRPAQMRSYQNRLFQYEKSDGLGMTSQLMSMMTRIGIAP